MKSIMAVIALAGAALSAQAELVTYQWSVQWTEGYRAGEVQQGSFDWERGLDLSYPAYEHAPLPYGNLVAGGSFMDEATGLMQGITTCTTGGGGCHMDPWYELLSGVTQFSLGTQGMALEMRYGFGEEWGCYSGDCTLEEARGFTTFAALTPVPEPASYALMLLGLAALGAAARRRAAAR